MSKLLQFLHFYALILYTLFQEFVNIMLSRTQRRTPTVIRRHYVISRIRRFYMVKVRFITEQFRERFSMILEEFPKIDVSLSLLLYMAQYLLT